MKAILLIIIGAILTLSSKAIAAEITGDMSIVVWAMLITVGVIVLGTGIHRMVK